MHRRPRIAHQVILIREIRLQVSQNRECLVRTDFASSMIDGRTAQDIDANSRSAAEIA